MKEDGDMAVYVPRNCASGVEKTRPMAGTYETRSLEAYNRNQYVSVRRLVRAGVGELEYGVRTRAKATSRLDVIDGRAATSISEGRWSGGQRCR